ncbi:MAG: type II toxin-antitoxin system VapC family toxin [Niabella sp.]
MGYKLFLDTNIVVDYFIADRSTHEDAIALFTKISNMEVKAYFSESVINTASYLIRKHVSSSDLKIVMMDLLNYIQVLPCSNLIISEAYTNAANDLEEAVLYQIALRGKMDYFITSNIKDFKKIKLPSVEVLSAKQFLQVFN